MSNQRSRRRYRKCADRRVWVFSELNHDLTPEQMAKVLVSAALEQGRLEQEARRQHVQEDERADHDHVEGEAGEVTHD